MVFTGIAYSFPVRNNLKNIEVRKVIYSRKTERMTKGDEGSGRELKSITEGKSYLTPKHMCAYKSIPYEMLHFQNYIKNFVIFHLKDCAKDARLCTPAGSSVPRRWVVWDVCELWGCCPDLRWALLLYHQ